MINATMSQKPLETAHAMTHVYTKTMKDIADAQMKALQAMTTAYFDGITTCCKLSEENLQQSTKTGTTTGK